MYEYLQIKTCIDSVINFQDCFKWSRCRCGESLWCGVGLTCQKNNYVGIQNVRWVCRSESPGWRLIMHWCKLEIRDTRIDTSPNISRSPRQCSVLVQLEKFSSDLKKRCLLAAPLKSRKGKRKKVNESSRWKARLLELVIWNNFTSSLASLPSHIHW